MVVWWGWLLFMFFKRFSSDEYLQLKQELSSLRIEFENIKLTFDLVKKKLRSKAKLDEIEENPAIEGVILPE